MSKAVIFDMDGVLIDSEPANLQLIADYFQLHGKRAEDAYLHSLVGRSSHDTWDLTLAAWGETISYEDYERGFHAYWKEHPLDYKQLLFPHVEEVLAWLKEQGYLIAVASSSKMDTINEVLNRCDIANYFDCKVSGEQFKRSKPDPEIYLKTAELLCLPVSECIAVEDSKAGIASCNAANMKVIARIDDRFGADPSQADVQIHDLLEIKSYLMKMAT